MASKEKEAANKAANALAEYFKEDAQGRQHVDTLVRYGGELRRHISALQAEIDAAHQQAGSLARQTSAQDRELLQLRTQTESLQGQLQSSRGVLAALADKYDKLRVRWRHLVSFDPRKLPPANVTLPDFMGTTLEIALSERICAQSNPLYAGMGDYPQIVDDPAWIYSAIGLAIEQGLTQFLINQLAALRLSVGPGKQEAFIQSLGRERYPSGTRVVLVPAAPKTLRYGYNEDEEDT